MREATFILVSLLIACSDGSADDAAGVPTGGADGSAGSPPTAGTTPPVAGESSAGGASAPPSTIDAAVEVDAANAQPSGAVTPERLFPLAVGNRWIYNTTSFGGSAACLPGEHTTQIMAMQEVDGRNAFRAVLFCMESNQFYAFTDLGLELRNVEGTPESTIWREALPRPIVEGAVFANDDRSIAFVGRVEVPAGVFEDCWQVTWGIGTQTYCPDVGNVLTTVYDTEVGIRSELTSFVLN